MELSENMNGTAAKSDLKPLLSCDGVEAYHADIYDLMKTIDDGSIDLIVTDPPYGSLDLDWDVAQDYSKLFPEFFRITKENAAIIIFSQQPYATDIIQAARKYFRYEIIWEKTMKLGYVNAKKMPLRGHENLLVFYKKLPIYNPQKYYIGQQKWARETNQAEDRYSGYGPGTKKSVYVDDGYRYPHSVLEISNFNGGGRRENIHPTQKPIDLFRWLIRSYSNERDLIFDGFAGSFTAGIACIQENRRFLGCEKEAEFFEKAKKRILRKLRSPELPLAT